MRARGGQNVFSEYGRPGFFTHLFDQIKSPFALVLLLAFVITLVLHEYIDAVVIAFALLIAVGLGVFQEGKASRAFEALAQSQQHRATILRDGERHEVDAAEIVVGDIVELEAGAQVPADMRLVKTKQLTINEASLTGEWLAVNKHAETILIGAPFVEKTNMAWKGTYIASGHGVGVVVAIGDQTEVGKIAEKLSTITDSKTPLQREMLRVSNIMLGIIGVLVMCIFILGILSGGTFEEMFLMAIAIAVASIPEGLPAAVTVVLAVAMESLLKRGGLVRSLLAAETLGSTTYVLTDKTGTLTEAKMAVTSLVVASDASTAKILALGDWKQSEHARTLFDTALCASDAYIEKDEHDSDLFTIKGESMERAMLEAAQRVGVSTTGDSARAARTDYLAFTSENRFAAGLFPHVDAMRLCVNGAPEYLLEAATSVHTEDEVVPMSAALQKQFADAIEAHTKRGERLVAVAYKAVDWDEIDEERTTQVLEEIVFMGLLVFHDPIREGVRESIEGVRRAGAQVRLVTGDNPNTARSVARMVGILPSDDADAEVCSGDDIALMDDKTLWKTLKHVYVFARVLPQEKMRIATILQERGEVVAMTGDGVNDAAALRKADIGIAVGSGTEVAKEASDLVLVNDSFSIIYAAIEEGRRVVSNLRKVVGYMLSTSMSEVLLIMAALLIGAPAPLVPTQILWANLIEGGLMSVAFAFEPGEKRAMEQKPYNVRTSGVLSRDMLGFMILVGSITGGLLIALYLFLQSLGASLSEIRSAMFLAVTIDSLFITFSFRSLTVPFWKISLKSNLFFLGAFVFSFGLFILVLTIPFLQYLLSYEPLPFFDIMLLIGFGIATLATIEGAKWIFFERAPRA